MATPTNTGTEVPHEAHGGALPAFDFNTYPSQLLWLAITFGLLWLMMAKVALPRVKRLLDDRHAKIFGDLDEATRLKKQSEAAQAAYDKALSEAKKRAAALADEARAAVNADFDAKKAAAEAELQVKLDAAQARITAVKDAAMKEVGGIAKETAEAIVAHLTGASARVDAAISDALKG